MSVPPNTRRGASDVWSVFRDSGYLDLSRTSEGEFDSLRPAFEHCYRALAGAAHLGCQINWPGKGHVEATVANFRLFERAWFSCHLAVRPSASVQGQAERILTELYSHYVRHSMEVEGPRWQIAFVQTSAHWSHHVHVEIPRRFAGTGEGLVTRMRVFDVPTVGKGPTSRESFDVGPATDQELHEVLAHLSASQPRIYCDALDYTPGRFRLERLSTDWAEAGLERAREMLVARASGRVVAAGVLDYAEHGLHLFGLQNTLRLYSLDGGLEAFPCLLLGARAWFRQLGLRSFCYLDESGWGHGLFMSDAYMTLLSVDRYPEMLELLHEPGRKSA